MRTTQWGPIILDGTQPKALTSRRLLKLPALPLDWSEQRKLLGFS